MCQQLEELNISEPIFSKLPMHHYQINTETHMEFQNRYKDYFKLKIFEVRQMQKKSLPGASLI